MLLFHRPDTLLFPENVLHPLASVKPGLSLRTASATLLPYPGEDMQTSDFFRHPVGTGPYKLVSWDEGQAITLERNESYFKGPANMKRDDPRHSKSRESNPGFLSSIHSQN